MGGKIAVRFCRSDSGCSGECGARDIVVGQTMRHCSHCNCGCSGEGAARDKVRVGLRQGSHRARDKGSVEEGHTHSHTHAHTISIHTH